MDSLYLNPQTWDLSVDIFGNIALAEDPYSLAQNAATACRTFSNDVYYDQTIGIPYFQNILGQLPTLQYVKSQLVTAALTVPGVVSAQAFITGVVNRQLQGQIQVTDANGNTTVAGLGSVTPPPLLDSTFILDQSELS